MRPTPTFGDSSKISGKKTSLIIECSRYKQLYENCSSYSRSLDSLLSVTTLSNEQKIREISNLKIDNFIAAKHVATLQDFTKNTVTPFYQEELKKAKKTGRRQGRLQVLIGLSLGGIGYLFFR